MPHYAVRITHSYEHCKRVIGLWALRCQKMIVYEHEGEKTNKVHIHVALFNTSIDKKQLRNVAASTGLPCKGNENMAFTKKDWDLDPIYITYMTKGKHDPKYNKGYSDEEVSTFRNNWVEPAVYQKKDPKDVELYNDWHCEDMEFYLVRRSAMQYVYNNVCPVWNAHAINQYKMLVRTYLFRHPMIRIPDEFLGKFMF